MITRAHLKEQVQRVLYFFDRTEMASNRNTAKMERALVLMREEVNALHVKIIEEELKNDRLVMILQHIFTRVPTLREDYEDIMNHPFQDLTMDDPHTSIPLSPEAESTEVQHDVTESFPE